jgi:hypothetical protein
VEVLGREAEKNEEVERSEVEGSISEDIDEVNEADDTEEAAEESEKDDADVGGGANGRSCSASPGGTRRSRITGAPPKMPLPAVARLWRADEVSNDTDGTRHAQRGHTYAMAWTRSSSEWMVKMARRRASTLPRG